MGRVAGNALIQWRCVLHDPTGCCYAAGVGLVTFQTIRLVAMSCMVTGGAVQIGMFGGKYFNILIQLGMTGVTALGKGATCRDVERGMCLLMTAAALNLLLPVGMTVTAVTFGQDFFIVGLPGNIAMHL